VPGADAAGAGMTTQLRRNPVPYLLAVAMASNIGSVATATGKSAEHADRQLLGHSLPRFRRRAIARCPRRAGRADCDSYIGLSGRISVCRATSDRQDRCHPRSSRSHVEVDNRVGVDDRVVLSGMGWPIAKVALVAGALLLVTRRITPERVYAEIDWSLLVLFIGLFIVVRGVEKTSLSTDLFAIV